MKCSECERAEAVDGHLLCWDCVTEEAEDHGWSEEFDLEEL